MMTHLAAVSPGKGQPFQLQTRPTPKPGPGELLIAVKSVALNPADTIMRAHGLFIPADSYPTVIGFDMSGLVLEVGEDVPKSDTTFRPGTRIAAYAASAWRSCNPDYGVFQERCLVPWQHCIALPDEVNCNISWNHAATLPVSVEVPFNAWDALGLFRVGGEKDQNPINPDAQKEALLIWGASSSVGTMGVQTARLLLHDDPNSPIAAIYATAGSANREYVTSLGADRVFDYKDPCVADAIVSAARQDGLVIRHCFLATGDLAVCQAVLGAFVTADGHRDGGNLSKIASAPVIPPDAGTVDGVQTIFVVPPSDEKERLEQFGSWLGGDWVRENLAKGRLRPSPEPTVVGMGLEAINFGLDLLAGGGVSCTKLVVEVSR